MGTFMRGMTHMEWLAYSHNPDPLKDVRVMLGSTLAKMEPQPTKRGKLLTKLIQWAQISHQAIPKLYRSIRRKLRECTTKHIGHSHC